MDGTSDASIALGFLILAGLLSFYLLPAIIGSKRGVSSSLALFILNLMLGWTVIGWVVCLIWAVSGATRAQDQFFQDQARISKAPIQPTKDSPWQN